MAAGKYDMYIEQGADFYLLVTFKNSLGNSIDLTGHTFSGKVRSTASSSTVIAEFDFTVLDQTQDATKGQIEIRLPSAESSAITLEASPDVERKLSYYTYDIESVSSGNVVRWLEGLVTISPEVTR
jgi:hypothetical protein